MYCKHCGHELEDGAVFCSECGRPVTDPSAAAGPKPTILAGPEDAPSGTSGASSASRQTRPSTGASTMGRGSSASHVAPSPEPVANTPLADAVSRVTKGGGSPVTLVNSRYMMLVPLIVNAFIAANTLILYLARLSQSSVLFSYYSPGGSFAAYALFTLIPVIILVPSVWGLADSAAVLSRYRRADDALLGRDIVLSVVLLAIFFLLLVGRGIFGMPVYDEAGSVMYWTFLQYGPMALTYLIPEIVSLVVLIVVRSMTGRGVPAPSRA